MSYSIEREGRQFGFVTRVRVYAAGETTVGEQVAEAEGALFASKLYCKVWARQHGYGWPTVK